MDRGRCEKHSTATLRPRLTAAQRGYDSRWTKARLGFLKAHPICEECKRDKKITAANTVDHIIPHKGNKSLFWDSDNWQSMCARCHSRKTASEDGGFGNA